MAIHRDKWAKARVMFEAGKVLTDIEHKTGINFSTIGKKAKKEGWVKSKNANLIANEVKVIAEKGQLNPNELEFHRQEVDRLSKDELMIRTLTKNNMVGVGKKLNDHQSLNMLDHKNAQDLIDKASITLGVNQRHAQGVNVQQNTQVAEIVFTRAKVVN